MRIAVVGTGLAGLGATYFLLKKGYQVTLFDEWGVGKGASSIPIGLCHPYPGRSGKPSKFAYEAMVLTNELITFAESHSGKKLADRSGIMRYDWVPHEWYSDLQERDGGVLITSGMTVLMQEYVLALYDALGVSLQEGKPEGVDVIVYASPKQVDLPVSYVKGQVLIGKGEVKNSLMKAQGHLSPLGEGLVQLGSTYEHHYESDSPDIEVAKRDLREKRDAFFPRQNFSPMDCRAGIRSCVKGSYLPIVKQLTKNSYVFTGLGSRGLLYHAYYGRELANLLSYTQTN